MKPIIISFIIPIFGLSLACDLPTWEGKCSNSRSRESDSEIQSLSATFTSPSNPIWAEEFDTDSQTVLNSRKWTANRTSAYVCQNHNPGWNKLDWIQPHEWHVHVKDNKVTFRGARSNLKLENGKEAYNVGWLTTEYSTERFMVKTDNYIETYIKLPNRIGAWPGLFTWYCNGVKGCNEVNMYEYHPQNPNVIELTSHLHGGTSACRFTRDWIQPLKWIKIGTSLGKDEIKWYVNNELACTKKGVGADWKAYLNMKISAAAGDCNPGPKAPNPGEVLWYRAEYLRVYENISYCYI